MLYAPLTSPLRATCPAHLILALITLTILGEEYKPCSSSLCSFLQLPVISSLLDFCHIITGRNGSNTETVAPILVEVACGIIKLRAVLIFVSNYILSTIFSKRRLIFHLHFIIRMSWGGPTVLRREMGSIRL
jgi:hypothetical protein